MATHVTLDKNGAVYTIAFSEDVERHPCTLDWDVLAELERCIAEVRASQECRVVIVESRSPKSFVVGANLAVLKTQDETNIGDWVKNGHRIFNQLQHLPQPVIAKVAKNALGGGLELAMACDFIIAGENARFGHPEAGLGVMPGWGGSYRLRMLVGPARAKEMIFTAQPIDAATACAWGLVNRVYKEEELDGAVEALAAQMVQNDGGVLAFCKDIINQDSQEGMQRNAFQEAATSAVCMASPSTKRRLEAFFERRAKK